MRTLKENNLLERAKRYDIYGDGELGKSYSIEEDIKLSSKFEGYELQLIMTYIKAEKNKNNKATEMRIKWDSIVAKYSV